MKTTFLALLAAVLTAGTAVTAAPSPPAAPSSYGANSPAFANVIKAKRPLNIMITNDDSWASANIRATYYALLTAGHKAIVVAPVANQSGKGGTVVFPTSKTLTAPGRYNSVPVGAPYSGANATDAGLNYFDSTPAGSALWGLDMVVPKYFNGAPLDLVVSGPNEGPNLGAFVSDLSGTVGAMRAAVGRGIPAIALSATTSARDYATLDFANKDDESIILGTSTANFITLFAENAKKGRLLPLGVGANANFGKIVNACKPQWAPSRLSGGGALTDKVVINADGLPTYADLVGEGLQPCINGVCSLPGETARAKEDCTASVSLITVDYDAPTDVSAPLAKPLAKTLKSLNRRR